MNIWLFGLELGILNMVHGDAQVEAFETEMTPPLINKWNHDCHSCTILKKDRLNFGSQACVIKKKKKTGDVQIIEGEIK